MPNLIRPKLDCRVCYCCGTPATHTFNGVYMCCVCRRSGDESKAKFTEIASMRTFAMLKGVAYAERVEVEESCAVPVCRVCGYTDVVPLSEHSFSSNFAWECSECETRAWLFTRKKVEFGPIEWVDDVKYSSQPASQSPGGENYLG